MLFIIGSVMQHPQGFSMPRFDLFCTCCQTEAFAISCLQSVQPFAVLAANSCVDIVTWWRGIKGNVRKSPLVGKETFDSSLKDTSPHL